MQSTRLFDAGYLKRPNKPSKDDPRVLTDKEACSMALKVLMACEEVPDFPKVQESASIL